ncbi:hypothetical protein [Pararhodobacter sp.]|uniref:hypothetical protein n=1 Tax=Pararhodobacter sp. TaxID=2127056 RepID=UPI002FDDB510
MIRHALIPVAALALLGACAPGPDADGGIPASRHVLFEGEEFGFFNYEAGATGQGIGDDWRPAESVITIVSREGRPVTEADQDSAARLARQICEEGGREFNTRSRGSLMRRGGISFAGDCREW